MEIIVNPKVLHLSYSANQGGAARAALRIHRGQIKLNLNSTFFCVNSNIHSDDIMLIPNNSFEYFEYKFRKKISNLYSKIYVTNNPILHSGAFLYSSLHKKINLHDCNLVNLHWVNYEMMSISDISKINKPIVWTLHDMWPFCGSEHVSYDNKYIQGYSLDNNLFNCDYWVWRNKIKTWTKPMNIVAPSNWMAKCAKSSMIMKDWPVTVIPNMIDTKFWAPIDKMISRDILGLPQDKKILIFGGANGGFEYHKGEDLLVNSLKILKQHDKNIFTVNIGSDSCIKSKLIDLYIGSINNDILLKLYYSASDVLLIPSRVDNFPNMALEAMSCGLPIVSFNIGGLPDICDHKLNGYLASPFSIDDFVFGVNQILTSSNFQKISSCARSKIVENFSEEVIVGKYNKLYERILN